MYPFCRRGFRLALSFLLLASASWAQSPTVDRSNWGSVTAPVYGTSEKGVYSAAELFAGPNKFGTYYNGVLPNGRIIRPAGTVVQVGMNPLGLALTPDGRYLITSNDDERDSSVSSLTNPANAGAYSLSVLETSTMKVVSSISASGYFIGLQASGSGPYTVWASGGVGNDVKIYTISTAGAIAAARPAHIAIKPITSSTAGYVSNHTPSAAFNTKDAAGNLPPVPTGMSRNGNHITFPAGSALSPDGKFLYVACNGDNSVAVIDTAKFAVVKQLPVGYFPYTVSVNRVGDRVMVSNWGVTEYKFAKPQYDASGQLVALGSTGNQPDGFYVPVTDTTGSAPKTSSVSVLAAPGANGARLETLGAIYHGHTLDAQTQVGDTHPSALAIVRQGSLEVLFVTKSNSDSLGMMVVQDSRKLPDFDLAPISVSNLPGGAKVHGTYPNALAVSPDNTRLYVAEAGLNSVAVLDVSSPLKPVLVGRIPTAWYPSALAISPDGRLLYIASAKGIAEDINPATDTTSAAAPTGVASFKGADSNYMFGTVQKVDVASAPLDNAAVLANNFTLHAPADTTVVPAGGAASTRIKHVFFILKENKTFDSMLGNRADHFGVFASTSFNDQAGKPTANGQYTGVVPNFQWLATHFATAANFYSDSDESDAGHQFCASGTSTDYSEKTLLVKSGRGVLVNKNMEPEDYPESGYIFNNAARNGVSFKDYGDLIRIAGTDTGASSPTTLSDKPSGQLGYPVVQADKKTLAQPLQNVGDVDSSTLGLGQSYFLALPILDILGTRNPNGEPRLDRNYPGYNFNISDQRRALEFIHDFDAMAARGTVPQLMHIYLPNDHTGSTQAPNRAVVTAGPMQQVADGDVALGMLIEHIMQSPIYYDPATGTGSAIFITYDDSQSTLDHIHLHRNSVVVVSPFAKPGYVAARHYSTASIVKTEELLLGLPPNNIHDLVATDLRDMFQPAYNNIQASAFTPTRQVTYQSTPEGSRIWKLVTRLETASGPDRDSLRLGQLARLSAQADQLHADAEKQHGLKSRACNQQQKELLKKAQLLVSTGAPKRDDD
jgi:YVTN family beta-propeller protein